MEIGAVSPKLTAYEKIDCLLIDNTKLRPKVLTCMLNVGFLRECLQNMDEWSNRCM
jgi:hypothetical protein